MNRIRKKFEDLKSRGTKALIPYITPEFPFRGVTVALAKELERSGADLLEIGIPFSDPLADGPTIQHSSEVALKNGVNLATIFAAVRDLRRTSELPVLLMGYVNPVLHFGIEKFMHECASAGVDGLIIPDLPPEEADAIREASQKSGISNVFLIAPTTSDQRIEDIDGFSTDFSYCVSVTGVTGARIQLGSNGSLDRFLRRVKERVRKRFVVGFGISAPEHVRHVWEFADGAVVGSALVNALSTAATADEAIRNAGFFLKNIRPH